MWDFCRRLQNFFQLQILLGISSLDNWVVVVVLRFFHPRVWRPGWPLFNLLFNIFLVFIIMPTMTNQSVVAAVNYLTRAQHNIQFVKTMFSFTFWQPWDAFLSWQLAVRLARHRIKLIRGFVQYHNYQSVIIFASLTLDQNAAPKGTKKPSDPGNKQNICEFIIRRPSFIVGLIVVYGCQWLPTPRNICYEARVRAAQKWSVDKGGGRRVQKRRERRHGPKKELWPCLAPIREQASFINNYEQM